MRQLCLPVDEDDLPFDILSLVVGHVDAVADVDEVGRDVGARAVAAKLRALEREIRQPSRAR